MNDGKVNIAVVGMQGVGKSSWINHFRGVTNESDSSYAKVGSGLAPCTKEPKAYPCKEVPSMLVWDLPGAEPGNIINWWSGTGFKTDAKIHLYDVFIMLFQNELRDAEHELVKVLVGQNKPVYFAQTKVDDQIKRKANEVKKNHTAEKQQHELEKFAEELRQRHKEAFLRKNSKIELTSKKVFLLTDSPEDGWISDNESLKQNLLLNHAAVNIAVIGESGVGKSSWINLIRNIKDKNDPLYAPENAGSDDCTREMTPYRFKDNYNLSLWDVPGAGTNKFPLETYPEKINMDLYNAFIMLTHNRFTKIDGDVLEQIMKTKKPYYLARTKVDIDMEDIIEDVDNLEPLEKKKQINEFVDKLRKGLLEKICEKDINKSDVFLITKRPQKLPMEWIPDNEKLTLKIMSDLPEYERAAFAKGVFPSTHKQVDEKVKMLRKVLYVATLSSAAGGAIPIPGISVLLDLDIMGAATIFQMKTLGIFPDAVEIRSTGYRNKLWKYGEFMEVVKKEMRDEDDKMTLFFVEAIIEGLHGSTMISKFILTVPALVVAQSADEFIKAIPVVGSIIGGLLGVATSGTTTYYILSKSLDACAKIAKAIITLINQQD